MTTNSRIHVASCFTASDEISKHQCHTPPSELWHTTSR